jgi:hypothetical protein
MLSDWVGLTKARWSGDSRNDSAVNEQVSKQLMKGNHSRFFEEFLIRCMPPKNFGWFRGANEIDHRLKMDQGSRDVAFIKGDETLTVPSTPLFSANPLFAAQSKDSVGQITNDRFRLSNRAIREEKGSESIET